MSWQLRKHVTTESWSEPLLCPGTVKVDLQVANSDVDVEFSGDMRGRGFSEEYFGPTAVSLPRRTESIRVKSATPGKPAVVTITAYPRSETA